MKYQSILEAWVIVASSLAMLFFLIWWHTPATIYSELIDVRFYPVDRVVIVEKPVILPHPYQGTIPLYPEREQNKKRVAGAANER